MLAWAVWVLTMLGLAVAAWLDHLQRQAGSPETAWLLQPASIPLLVAAVSAATVGALLGGRRPAHPVGWLLLLASGCWWWPTASSPGTSTMGC